MVVGAYLEGEEAGKLKKNQNEHKKVKLVTEWSLESDTSNLSLCRDRVRFELSRLKRPLLRACGGS